MMLYLVEMGAILSSLPVIHGEASESAATERQPSELLSNDSVVLITGAGSHLGSQLAMTLYRTYNVSKLILIDELNANDIYLPPNYINNLNEQFVNKPPLEQKLRSENSLAAFEYKRQIIFNVMQTVQDRGYFYRVDFRPLLPQYEGTPSESPSLGLPVLNMIFEEHNITHVVHLDENVLDSSLPARVVSKKKEDDRMGMMDALLEQLAMKIRSSSVQSQPQFVYASSGEIYTDEAGEKKEDLNITFSASSTIQGTARLLDEILATSYSDLYDVRSIGLRFFEVYGPWSSPDSEVFQMAERALSDDTPIMAQPLKEESDYHNLKDYVYIDDAVDVILLAMQFVSPLTQNLIVNVGSGKGLSLVDVALMMERHFPRRDDQNQMNALLKWKYALNDPKSSRIASTERARALLGFESRMSFNDGIEKTLAWHHDRAFPYGHSTKQLNQKWSNVLNSGIRSCHPFDSECLNGLIVYPCISKCARAEKCIPSIYDKASIISKAITKSCESVMYTIDLERDTNSIPSGAVNYSSEEYAKIFVPGSFCNIAFVREDSELMRRLIEKSDVYDTNQNIEAEMLKIISSGRKVTKYNALSFGIWTVLPVSITGVDSSAKLATMKMMPKFSPDAFFESKYALFCNPDIVLKDVPTLLKNVDSRKDASTLLILGSKSVGPLSATSKIYSVESFYQEKMYGAISLTLKNHFGTQTKIETHASWIMHSLGSNDARELRCDIFGEMINWKVKNDIQSIKFILYMHNFWTTALARWKGEGIWWKGDEVNDNDDNIAVFCGGKRRCLVRLLPDNQSGFVRLENK